MKHFFSKITVLMLFLAVGFTACEKDEETSNFDFRDDYVGEWNAQFQSDEFGPQTYTVNITKSTQDENQIIISNFYNLGSSESVVVNASDNDLLISSQVVKGNTIEGTGSSTASFDKINFTYTAFDGAVTDNVTATYVKAGLRLPWENPEVTEKEMNIAAK